MEDVESAECPVSLITPDTAELLRLFTRAERLQESGTALFGPDLSAWPAWAVDAFDVLTTESIRYENAKWEAEKAER